MIRSPWFRESTAHPAHASLRLLPCVLASLLGLPLFTNGCSTANKVTSLEDRSLLDKLKAGINNAKMNGHIEEAPEEPPHKPTNFANIHLKYAEATETEGHHAEARKHYLEAAKINPKSIPALTGLARTDSALGNDEEAEANFKKAIKLDPRAGEPQYELGRFYATKKRWSEAVGPLNKAMLAAPEVPQYRYDLAIALAYAGQVDAALPLFVRTVGDAEAHYNVALILKDQDQTDQAIHELELALAKKPKPDTDKKAQHWLRQLRGEVEEASELALANGTQPATEDQGVRPVAFATAGDASKRHVKRKFRVQLPADDEDEMDEISETLTQQQIEQRRNQSGPPQQ